MMKNALVLLFSVLYTLNTLHAQGIKLKVIYNNGLTHTNIKGYFTYVNDTIVKEDVYYTVTSSAMWTGKLKTQVVYNGNLAQMANFFKEIRGFAKDNIDSIGANTKIEERINVSITKVAGIKCITIKNGSEIVNTNFKSINEAVKALDDWIQNNK